MPQMMPMNWLLIYNFCIMSMMLMCLMLFYSFNYNKFAMKHKKMLIYKNFFLKW